MVDEVFVVGHRGMLGHVVARYLAQLGYRVVTSDERYRGGQDDTLVAAVKRSGCRFVVNALGRNNPKVIGALELVRDNSVFPVHLLSQLDSGQRLIHASSDGVFSGQAGPYPVEHIADAVDDYGLSKRYGEAVATAGRAIVIRTSIVGPDPAAGRGLMAWLQAQSGAVSGFTNHLWNGVTTLEWAKVCGELMASDSKAWPAVVQPGVWPAVSKCALLEIMASAWGLPVTVQATEHATALNRALIPTLQRKSLVQQLQELRQWSQR